MTFKKWNRLFEHYKEYHNMKIKQGIFRTRNDETESEEWLKD